MEENNTNVMDLIEGQAYAKIIRDDDGCFHVVDFDGTVGPVCKYCEENDKTIVLTKNAAMRQYYSRKKANEAIDKNGYAELTYRKPRENPGTPGTKLPNAKLIAYLSEEDQAEYKAIIERARGAMAAEKAKPKTELEKAQAKLAKLKAQLAKLEAMTAEDAE